MKKYLAKPAKAVKNPNTIQYVNHYFFSSSLLPSTASIKIKLLYKTYTMDKAYQI
jgi:hypothetical protein